MYRSARIFPILCFAVQACAAANTNPWLRVKSANFELFTTAGERSGRDLIRHFEHLPVRQSKLPIPSDEPQGSKVVGKVREGMLESIECVGKLARLHIRVLGVPKVFAISDPATVTVRSGPSDFPGVAGRVRALDFP